MVGTISAGALLEPITMTAHAASGDGGSVTFPALRGVVFLSVVLTAVLSVVVDVGVRCWASSAGCMSGYELPVYHSDSLGEPHVVNLPHFASQPRGFTTWASVESFSSPQTVSAVVLLVGDSSAV